MRIQFATEGTRVRVGPAFQFRDGCYQGSERTIARAEGIKKFQANYPWVDSVDIQMFLEGFDVGEEYCTTAQTSDHGNQGASHTHQRMCKEDHP
jgi:hypothetical protein